MTALTSTDIEAIHASHGTSYPIAANYFVGVVRKMFNWGRAAGKVHRDVPDPGVGIVRFPQRKRRRFVTTVELPRLLAAIEGEEDEYARHALWLLRPFRRLRDQPSGGHAGLGLAMVERLVHVGGGHLDAAQNDGGFAVTFRFPSHTT